MKTIEFRQRNMYCNICMMNVLSVLSGLRGVRELNINMQNKTIYLQTENNAMGKQKIQELVNKALTFGVEPAIASTHGGGE